MITRLAWGGLIPILLHAAAAQQWTSGKCGESAKGGFGKYPIEYYSKIDTFDVDQTQGFEAAFLSCSFLCCNKYDIQNYPCDLAVVSFNTRNDAEVANCQHMSCYDDNGFFRCKFVNVPYDVDRNGVQFTPVASWVYAFTAELDKLIDNDGAKAREAIKMQGNITNKEGQGVGMFSVEETIRKDTRDLEGEKEFQAMARGAFAQSKIDNVSSNRRLMRFLTPILVIAMILIIGFATVTMKYRKLKKTIKYNGIKDADYYTKLDPADMAAEQEAQNLINGAYDI